MKLKRSQITVLKIKARFEVKLYLFCSLVEGSTAMSENLVWILISDWIWYLKCLLFAVLKNHQIRLTKRSGFV